MKKQYVAPTDTLTAYFNEQKENSEAGFKRHGVDAALESISTALKDLNDIGIDVQLQLNQSYAEESWSLINKVNGIAVNSNVILSGILKIDHVEHLLVVSSSENEIPALKIYVAGRDYASRHLQSDFRGTCYDLNEDPEAIYKLQQFIVEKAADNEIIRKHDIHGSFNKEHPAVRLEKTSAAKPPRL